MDATERIRRYFDAYGEQEWERLVSSPAARVSLEVHRRFLAPLVRDGSRVLEIGAGPGRFTIELARLGARVVVTDLSEVQLDLNAVHVAESGCEGSVEDRFILDLRDLSRFDDDEFDLVLAYGGPLSYVFEDATEALRGCLRVAPLVVGSVMSTLGAWRKYLGVVGSLEAEIGPEASDMIVRTGDLRLEGTTDGHTCQMYRSREVVDLVGRAGGRVVAFSSSNWASLAEEAVVAEIAADAGRWARFLDLECEACREPGILDTGTHLLFAAERGSGHPPASSG